MTDLHRFINALKILTFIDGPELEDAGVAMDARSYEAFCSDPYRWLMKASDADAAKVWAMVEAQQPERGIDPASWRAGCEAAAKEGEKFIYGLKNALGHERHLITETIHVVARAIRALQPPTQHNPIDNDTPTHT